MTGQKRAEMIDIFTHILPPKYKDELDKRARHSFLHEQNSHTPALWDIEARFRIMDKHEGLKHVLTVALPPLEYVVDSKDAIDLARIANDEMAELVTKYPDRFIAAAACLPMNNIDAALQETERAIKELNFKGVQVFTPVNGRPLDSLEFMPLYKKMSEHDLPIWIHPVRDRDHPDYSGENHSRYGLFMAIGWPYETTAAMGRLVFGGVLEKYPDIKFITHHCGGMLPFFIQRIGVSGRPWLSKPSIEYFKKFYGDTALNGSIPALLCGYAFWGADHLVFGTDMPYGGTERGNTTEITISDVEAMDLSDSDKVKILSGNAKKLLRLPE